MQDKRTTASVCRVSGKHDKVESNAETMLWCSSNSWKTSTVWNVDESTGNTFQSMVVRGKDLETWSVRCGCILAAQYERHDLW